MILFITMLAVTTPGGETCTECESPFMEHTSFDLAVSFHDNIPFTAFIACYHYFGTANNTFNTLNAMDHIFYFILQNYQNESDSFMFVINKLPQTQIHPDFNRTNCSSSEHVVTVQTHFVITTTSNRTDIKDRYYVDTSKLLVQYFNRTQISLFYYNYHVSITIMPTSTDPNIIPGAAYQWQIATLFTVIFTALIVMVCVCREHYRYTNAFFVDDALVLIIGISQFDDKTQLLPGVQRAVQELTTLWRDIYKYSVVICNEETLYSTKDDVIDFVDACVPRIQGRTKAVIIHILSHGLEGNLVVSSDQRTIPIEFFKHELTYNCLEDKRSFVKLIFYHGCRGSKNYHVPNYTQRGLKSSQVNTNESPFMEYTAYSNFITIYGNMPGRASYDAGTFTHCICDAFSRNAKKMMKNDFIHLIHGISRDLAQKTKGAEICTLESSCQDRLIFRVSKRVPKWSTTLLLDFDDSAKELLV
eukprot:341284_1